MINIPRSKNNKYFLIKVSGDNFHQLMTKKFIDTMEYKFGKKNIKIISLDVSCLQENMFQNPYRFLISITKLIFRHVQDIYFFNIKKEKSYFYFDPFVLSLKDLKEIIKLLKSKNINNDYSYLGIHLGDLINDSLQRYCWNDWNLFKWLSKGFLTTFTFIILKKSIRIANKLKSENILYLAASTSYSHNGLPFRVMSKKSNFTCYSSMSVNHTWLEFSNYSRSPYINYIKIGAQLQSGYLFNLKQAEEIGRKGLLKRISGKNDSTLPYMKTSSFNGRTSGEKFDFNNASILYLHDLVDSSHHYPGFIFSNMIDYINFTLEILIKNRRKFFIKLHPNESTGSKAIRNKIFDKIKIPDNTIIPSYFSNHEILSSKIKNVLSAHGNIIIEAGFYGHFSIGATKGSPASSFKNLLKIPKNKGEYELLLLKNFNNQEKDIIVFESKLANFLLCHANIYMNDVDLSQTRKLYQDSINNRVFKTTGYLNLNFI
tara:strand:+ start:1780 stop:3237 length:1458 start_codon:yes stop_codon:yes gene_type:complete